MRLPYGGRPGQILRMRDHGEWEWHDPSAARHARRMRRLRNGIVLLVVSLFTWSLFALLVALR